MEPTFYGAGLPKCDIANIPGHLIVLEGAGGALVPISAELDMLDIARRLRLPVLLVVGIRLGCLNHALLSVQAIRARGLHLAGWVANRIDPAMARADELLHALYSNGSRAGTLDLSTHLDEKSGEVEDFRFAGAIL